MHPVLAQMAYQVAEPYHKSDIEWEPSRKLNAYSKGCAVGGSNGLRHCSVAGLLDFSKNGSRQARV